MLRAKHIFRRNPRKAQAKELEHLLRKRHRQCRQDVIIMICLTLAVLFYGVYNVATTGFELSVDGEPLACVRNLSDGENAV